MTTTPETLAAELMCEFYLSKHYDPKAARPADVVHAAIAFALSAQPNETAIVEMRDRQLIAYFKGRAAGFRAAAKRDCARVGPLAKAYEEAAHAILYADIPAIEEGEHKGAAL